MFFCICFGFSKDLPGFSKEFLGFPGVLGGSSDLVISSVLGCFPGFV